MNKIIEIIMVLLLFICLSISIYAQQNKNIIVITDLDDTYKITHSANKFYAIWNILTSTKTFSGMTPLFKLMMDKSKAFYILSNTPQFLHGKVEKLLNKNNFQPTALILKTRKYKKSEYKYNTILQILDSNPECKVILLGDNAGKDHEIYKRIATDFPTRVAAIYIRPVVEKRQIPSEIFQYYSAFDIAYYENLCNRLSEIEANQIADEVENTKNTRLLAPRFFHVPKGIIISDLNIQNQTLYSRKTRIFQLIQGIANRN